MRHVMIDLETIGITPRAPILSIAAVEYTLQGTVLDTFHACIDITSYDQLKPHFDIDYSTLKWWIGQPNVADVFMGSVKIHDALSEFVRWFSKMDPDTTQLWCQGADFDFPVLKHAMEVHGMQVPWKFWNQRDTRTLYSIVPRFSKPAIVGTAHNALDDCINQIACVAKAFKSLSVSK